MLGAVRWTRAARVGQQTQMRPVEISAALWRPGILVGSLVEETKETKGGSNLRPHLDHRLVPCDVWTLTDLDAHYCSYDTEDWRTVQC